MQKILSALIITICATSSVFADDSLNCDATDIGATTPKTRLRATWTPNTYNIGWYDEDGTQLNVQNAAQTCSYGSDLVIPDSAPSKVGYTFIGWEVESNPLLSVDISTDGNGWYGHAWHDNADFCRGTIDGNQFEDCSDMSDLPLNEWKTEFSYGTVKGVSVCNTTAPNNWDAMFAQADGTDEGVAKVINDLYGPGGAGIVSSDSFNTGTTGRFCWCRATSYTPTNGYSQNLSSLPWVSMLDMNTGEFCALYCPIYCAWMVMDSGELENSHTSRLFRAAVFGVTQ